MTLSWKNAPLASPVSETEVYLLISDFIVSHFSIPSDRCETGGDFKDAMRVEFVAGDLFGISV